MQEGERLKRGKTLEHFFSLSEWEMISKALVVEDAEEVRKELPEPEGGNAARRRRRWGRG